MPVTPPPVTADVLGLAAVVVLLLLVALIVDPAIRRRRAANRVERMRRHAAAGCGICSTALGPSVRRPAGGKGARR